MANMEASTVAQIVVHEYIARYGVPLEIHTDQGRQFEAHLFKDMCEALDIHKTRNSGYHAQTNGGVERANATILALLAIFAQDDQKVWDEKLNLALFAYKSATHASTGFTPFEMMMGRQPRLPLDLWRGVPPQSKKKTTSEFVETLQKHIADIHEFARQNLAISFDKQKVCYDTRAQRNSYSPGDAVWLFNSAKKIGITPKLACKWTGPFVVTQRMSSVNYMIQSGKKAKGVVVHFNRLKKYIGENPHVWFNPPQTDNELSKACQTEDDRSGENDTTNYELTNCESQESNTTQGQLIEMRLGNDMGNTGAEYNEPQPIENLEITHPDGAEPDGNKCEVQVANNSRSLVENPTDPNKPFTTYKDDNSPQSPRSGNKPNKPYGPDDGDRGRQSPDTVTTKSPYDYITNNTPIKAPNHIKPQPTITQPLSSSTTVRTARSTARPQRYGNNIFSC